MERYMAATTNGSELPGALAEAVEKIRREAYSAGWRDALAALNKAAAEMANEPSESFEISDMQAVPSSVSFARSGDPKTGSTPWYVLQAVRKRSGMTGSEVVSAVQDGGHKVSEASIRTSLTRLERKKLIESRHKKWFPK